jgi:hypothetical protein
VRQSVQRVARLARCSVRPLAGSEVLDRDGVALAIPATLSAASPAFRQAAAACGFDH